jgi:hypothetical protein
LTQGQNRQYLFQLEYIYEALPERDPAWLQVNFHNRLRTFEDNLLTQPNFLDYLKPPLIHLWREKLKAIDPTDPRSFKPDTLAEYPRLSAITSERYVFWGTAILQNATQPSTGAGLAQTPMGDGDQVADLLTRIFNPSEGMERYDERIQGPFRWMAWYMIPDEAIGTRFVFLDNGGAGGDK